MKISDVYKRLNLPPNLQMHMYRVASVANVIIDHWKGPVADRDIVTQATLLHDVGNIAKMDFVRYPHLLGEEVQRLEYWQEVQRKFIERYGNDQHKATPAILEELGTPEKIRTIIRETRLSRIEETLASQVWERKLYQYSDLRVAPFGVVTFEQRWREGQERYKHRLGVLNMSEALHRGGVELEKQIQEKVAMDLKTISDQTVEPYLKTLAAYEIEVT
jgi:hypothetical protein